MRLVKSKRLSIIIPLYNSEKYILKCLNSILEQDVPLEDFEIILVNDGSPDRSKALAKEFASRYPNIVVLSQENRGTSGARNTGIRYATGNYLYFIDPDDYILKNSLADILNKVEQESLDVLRFGYIEVDENYHHTRSCKNVEQPDYSSELMDGCSFMAKRLGIACYVWTYLFRTQLIKNNSLYFTEGVYFDDTPWLPQVLMHAKRVDSIDIKRHFYLIRNTSLVQAKDNIAIRKKINGQKYLITELREQMSRVRDDGAILWYQRMITHCVITLLTLAAQQDKYEVDSCISFISSQKVLPLSGKSVNKEIRFKQAMINLSPHMFCGIIRLKTKRKLF